MGLFRIQRHSQKAVASVYVVTEVNRTIPLDPDRPVHEKDPTGIQPDAEQDYRFGRNTGRIGFDRATRGLTQRRRVKELIWRNPL